MIHLFVFLAIFQLTSARSCSAGLMWQSATSLYLLYSAHLLVVFIHMCDHVCKHTLNSVSGLHLASRNHTTQPNMNEFHRLGWYQVSSLLPRKLAGAPWAVGWPLSGLVTAARLECPKFWMLTAVWRNCPPKNQKMHRLCVGVSENVVYP